jgi:hypothetical protein
VYVTMEVVDSVRTRAFHQSVLGWRFVPGRVADGWQAEAVAPMTGTSGGHPTATTVPMYRVDDIGTAVRSVRDAGGPLPIRKYSRTGSPPRAPTIREPSSPSGSSESLPSTSGYAPFMRPHFRRSARRTGAHTER